jgi:hypothetical protein
MTGAMSLQLCTTAPGQNHHSTSSEACQASGRETAEDLILVKFR